MRRYIKYIFVIVIILIYVMIVFFISGKTPIENTKGQYLVVGDCLAWQYKDKKWQDIDNINKSFEGQQFTVIGNNYTYNSLSMQLDSKNNWYFLQKNLKEIKLNDFRMAYTNLKIIPKLAKYNLEDMDSSDNIFLRSVLKKYDVKDYSPFWYAKKVVLDFDKDGQKEVLYAIANYTFDVVSGEKFAAIYLTKGDNLIQVLGHSAGEPYKIVDIMDLNGDGTDELIISYNIKDVCSLDSCYLLFTMKHGQFELTKNCSKE